MASGPYFYYVNSDYIDYLKQTEIEKEDSLVFPIFIIGIQASLFLEQC